MLYKIETNWLGEMTKGIYSYTIKNSIKPTTIVINNKTYKQLKSQIEKHYDSSLKDVIFEKSVLGCDIIVSENVDDFEARILCDGISK